MGRRDRVAQSTQRYLKRTQTAEWNTAIYARLSEENNGFEDDRSLQNQIKYLEEYVEKHPDLLLVDRYIDNGMTGTNFERAGFQRMMEDVKAGSVNCIVVKDLSRFGRNHIEAGYYLETIFPQLDIRFISINDNFDSMDGNGNGDIMVPLKNMINEMYARDTQRKILATFRAKEKKNERAFFMPPYGYVIDPDCNYHLLPDNEVADYVRLIFKLKKSGLGVVAIADRLNQIGAPTPMNYMKSKGKYENVECRDNWKHSGVLNILKNRTYTGATIYNTHGKGEYKVIPNTHEALVDEETFEAISAEMAEGSVKKKEAMEKGKSRSEKYPNVLQGVFYCSDCGRAISEIAKILNKKSIPTIASYNERNKMRGKMVSLEKSEYAAWTGTKVRNILLNEFYAGTYVSQRRKQVIAGMKKTVEVKNPVKIPNHHPAIISMEMFEKAQEIFRSRQSKYAVGRRYPLKSKVFCGNCGYAMAYRDNVYDECYFYCNHTMETGNNDGCPDERIPEEFLDARVFTQLKSWMMLLETACGNVDEAEQKRWEGLRLLNDEADTLQAEFKTLQSKKLELYESYSDGQISKEDFSTQKEKLSSEIDSIRTELNKLHEKEARLRKTRNRRKPELDDLMENVKLFENEKRLTCKMADTFAERVTVYDKWCIEITWKCEDSVEKALNEVAEADEMVG